MLSHMRRPGLICSIFIFAITSIFVEQSNPHYNSLYDDNKFSSNEIHKLIYNLCLPLLDVLNMSCWSQLFTVLILLLIEK